MRNYWLALFTFSMLTLAGFFLQAQTPPAQPQTIISGADIGFRVDGVKGDTPVGRLVVRIKGQWVEVESAVGVRRLTAR